MANIKLYGIKNCDTVKKAKRHLEQQSISYDFIDFRANEEYQSKLKSWLDEAGEGKIINKKSTTWRQLTEEQKQMTNQEDWVALLSTQPTLIKRPVLEHPNGLIVGFDATLYSQLADT